MIGAGEVYGSLTVLDYVSRGQVICQCECGRYVRRREQSLVAVLKRGGRSRCGKCLGRDSWRGRNDR